MLGLQVSSSDLDHLVLTERYRLLLGGVVGMTATELPVQRMQNGLVSLELDATAPFQNLQALETPTL